MTALTASDERALHDSDRSAWLAYVAPRMAAQLTAAADDAIGTRWAQLPRDYQRAVWAHLHTTTRARIRAARGVTTDLA